VTVGRCDVHPASTARLRVFGSRRCSTSWPAAGVTATVDSSPATSPASPPRSAP